MPEDPLPLGDRLEPVAEVAGGFGSAENEDAALTEREMEQRDHLPLHLGAQVNQHVATRYEVEARERRIDQQILRREHHHFPQLARHSIIVILLDEETFEARRRDVLPDRLRI